MDKWRTKLVWQAAGVPTPRYAILQADSNWDDVAAQLGLPIFVKPAREGSSIGMSRVESAAQLAEAYRKAAAFDSLVLAEQFIAGGEYTVAILAGQALPLIKLESANVFYDYEAKYKRDDTRYLCPCGLPEAQEKHIQQLALLAYDVVGCRGWARADVMLDAAGKPYFLEANTSPGMTDHSLVPMAARAAGMDFDMLVLKILELAHVG